MFDAIETSTVSEQRSDKEPPLALAVRSAPVAEIAVPVMSLHGDSFGMDRDMQKALNAAQHPVIKYVLQNLQHATVQQDPKSRQAEIDLSVSGKLQVAGVERPIVMDVIVKRDSRRHFLAHAQTPMLMSDFGVTPPGGLFGLIKASDKFLVIFDLDLVVESAPPAP